jgi:hypothetical protein
MHVPVSGVVPESSGGGLDASAGADDVDVGIGGVLVSSVPPSAARSVAGSRPKIEAHAVVNTIPIETVTMNRTLRIATTAQTR